MDLARLRRPGPGSWQWFMREWHGELEGYTLAELQDIRMPAELLDFYGAAGRRPTANLHLVPPGELVVADGRMRFLVEEQGVYSFETAAGSGEPAVWLVEDDSRKPLGEPLDRFLLQYALYEAAIDGPEGGWGHADRTALSAVSSVMPPLPLDAWPHPVGRVRFHAGDDLIGLVWDDGGSSLEVWAAARAPGPIRKLDGLVDWDRQAGSPPIR